MKHSTRLRTCAGARTLGAQDALITCCRALHYWTCTNVMGMLFLQYLPTKAHSALKQ